MEFAELVLKRRSVRKFKEDPVGNKVIERILEAGGCSDGLNIKH